MKATPRQRIWLALAMAAWCLVMVAVKFSAYWPYQLSRWGLCAGAALLALNFTGWRRIVAAVLAVIYNPLQPIAFEGVWPWVNVLSAGALIATAPDLQWQRRLAGWKVWCASLKWIIPWWFTPVRRGDVEQGEKRRRAIRCRNEIDAEISSLRGLPEQREKVVALRVISKMAAQSVQREKIDLSSRICFWLLRMALTLFVGGWVFVLTRDAIDPRGAQRRKAQKVALQAKWDREKRERELTFVNKFRAREFEREREEFARREAMERSEKYSKPPIAPPRE